jgi:hypothetical protein
MNNTCIYLRTGDPNIYMYMKRKYIKISLKEYNNRKANIHLTIINNFGCCFLLSKKPVFIYPPADPIRQSTMKGPHRGGVCCSPPWPS